MATAAAAISRDTSIHRRVASLEHMLPVVERVGA